MVRNLETIKSLPFENFKVFSKEGELMFRCNEKRVRWYLSRNLAEVANEPKTIRLKFQTNGDGHAGDEYYLSDRENRCVVCGQVEKLTRHHVVPRIYRRWFPEGIKRHHSHDVVLLCVPCHIEYEGFASALKQDLAEEYGVPTQGIGPFIDKDLAKAKRHACALHRHWGSISPRRAEILITFLKDYFKKEVLTREEIEKIAGVDPRIGPCVVHGQYVVANLKESVQSFVCRWRSHFLNSMRPLHLPQGWTVGRPITKGCHEGNTGECGDPQTETAKRLELPSQG